MTGPKVYHRRPSATLESKSVISSKKNGQTLGGTARYLATEARYMPGVHGDAEALLLLRLITAMTKH